MSDDSAHGSSEPPVHTGTEDVHAHPRHTGHRTFDIIMAVCAIFISAVSLFVAIEHGRTERDLVAANSWPFLSIEESDARGPGQDISIGATNAGVGPAKIRSFEMFFDGKPVTSPWDLLAKCCGMPGDAAGIRSLIPPGAVMMSVIDNTVLRPSDTNAVLILARAKTDRGLFQHLDQALIANRITFRACYCSSLDQCWVGDLASLKTREVAECPAPEHPYRYNYWPHRQ